jgi:hypothetical protein
MLQEQLTRGNVTVDIVMNEAVACRPVELRINGIKANFYDFGKSKDIDPLNAPPCGCANRVFKMGVLKPYTLNKYGLSPKDVEDLRIILEEKFSIGLCKRCK